jgi:hypothetical protein
MQVVYRNDSVFSGWIEVNPIANVFFRPEEVHGASGIAYIVIPLTERNGYVTNKSFVRIDIQYLTVSHHYTDRDATVHTDGIDLDCFSWKKPANCQRLEGSLTKPFLLTVHSDGILVGQVIEWGQGNDDIRFGENPAWKNFCKKGLNCFSALFHRDPESFSYFIKKGGLPGLNKTFHYDVISFV